MKENNIRKAAVMLALVQSLSFGGCKKGNETITNLNDSKPSVELKWTELGFGYRRLENDGSYYKLVQERCNPICTKNEDNTITYSAPSNCNMTLGSGSNLECYDVHYKQITKEEYENDRRMGIVIDSSYWYDENNILHLTKELNPICSRNEDGTILYTAPSCATRVEGSGSSLRCFIDYVIDEQEEVISRLL